MNKLSEGGVPVRFRVNCIRGASIAVGAEEPRPGVSFGPNIGALLGLPCPNDFKETWLCAVSFIWDAENVVTLAKGLFAACKKHWTNCRWPADTHVEDIMPTPHLGGLTE